MRISDLAEHNIKAANSLHEVSNGHVDLSYKNKPTCYKHVAMLAVTPDRHIWRCGELECESACFAEDL